jgi:hypothetical protein
METSQAATSAAGAKQGATKPSRFNIQDDMCVIPSVLCTDSLHPMTDMECTHAVYVENREYNGKNIHLYATKEALVCGIRDVLWAYKTRSPAVTAKITEAEWAELFKFCGGVPSK